MFWNRREAGRGKKNTFLTWKQNEYRSNVSTRFRSRKTRWKSSWGRCGHVRTWTQQLVSAASSSCQRLAVWKQTKIPKKKKEKKPAQPVAGAAQSCWNNPCPNSRRLLKLESKWVASIPHFVYCSRWEKILCVEVACRGYAAHFSKSFVSGP